jgi:hypothetical protein
MVQQEIIGNTQKIAIIVIILAGLFVIPSSAVTFTSGQASGPVIAKGDPVYITGIATGQPQVGLQVWVIGHNFLQVSTIPVNPDDSYTFELNPDVTQNLAPGLYYVLIQDPMENDQFDIIYDPATGNVINRQLGNGMVIFHMSGSGSLQSPNAAAALIQAISSQYIDDTFVTSAFTIDVPQAFINTVGDHAVGDRFTVAGSTNLAVGDTILIQIYSQSFGPEPKGQSEGFSGTSGTVQVVQGTGGLNRWSFGVDSSGWTPGAYLLEVTSATMDVTGSTTFNIVEQLPVTIVATEPPTMTATMVVRKSSTSVQPTASPEPTRSPVPLPVIIGGLALFFIIRQNKKKK